MREDIKKDIIETIADDGALDVEELVCRYGVTKQTIFRYINQLIDEKIVERLGKNKYDLVSAFKTFQYQNSGLSEDVIWRRDIAPLLPQMTKSAKTALAYVFMEMLNNAIEHSEANRIRINLWSNADSVDVEIFDDGVGIFEKIQNALNLPEKKFAVLELAKGKFTTEPDSHTGEGIFFSSKIADRFYIQSDDIFFMGNFDDIVDSVILESNTDLQDDRTLIFFTVYNDSEKDMNEVFERYTKQPEDFGFSKTLIPVKLLSYGEEDAMYLSRSQARRLLARLDKFENIQMDFEGIEDIGQGFADEIFRVFLNAHPNVKIVPVNCCRNVERMIKRVTQNKL